MCGSLSRQETNFFNVSGSLSAFPSFPFPRKKIPFVKLKTNTSIAKATEKLYLPFTLSLSGKELPTVFYKSLVHFYAALDGAKDGHFFSSVSKFASVRLVGKPRYKTPYYLLVVVVQLVLNLQVSLYQSEQIRNLHCFEIPCTHFQMPRR